MSLIRTIVAGVADIHAQDATLSAAVEMARHTGAELHVVHAFDLPAFLTMSPGMEYLNPAGAQQYTRVAQERLAMAVRGRCSYERLHVHALAGAGDRTILELAQRYHADLLVVGATRRGRIARTLLGTTAQRVLRGSTCPVYVVRNANCAAGRVLLTTDLGTGAAQVHERALDVLEALYGEASSTLHLLLVVMEGMVPPPLPRDAIQRVATAELSEFVLERAPRLRTPQPILRFGLPSDEIAAEAERWLADLVVLGTHNRSLIPRVLLGSVAEAALRDLHCNVLLIPPSEAPPLEGAERALTAEMSGV
jgi:universal stress protein E